MSRASLDLKVHQDHLVRKANRDRPDPQVTVFQVHQVHQVHQGHQDRLVRKENLVLSGPRDLRDLSDRPARWGLQVLMESRGHLVRQVLKDQKGPRGHKDLKVYRVHPGQRDPRGRKDHRGQKGHRVRQGRLDRAVEPWRPTVSLKADSATRFRSTV